MIKLGDMTQIPYSENPSPLRERQLKDFEKELYIIKKSYGEVARIIEANGSYVVQRYQEDIWESTFMRSYSLSECMLHLLKIYCTDVVIQNGCHWSAYNERKWLGKIPNDQPEEDKPIGIIYSQEEEGKEDDRSIMDMIPNKYKYPAVTFVITSIGVIMAIIEFGMPITVGYIIVSLFCFISFLAGKVE